MKQFRFFALTSFFALTACAGEGGHVQIMEDRFAVAQVQAFSIPQSTSDAARYPVHVWVLFSDKPVVVTEVDPENPPLSIGSAIKAAGARAMSLLLDDQGNLQAIHASNVGYAVGGFGGQTYRSEHFAADRVAGHYQAKFDDPKLDIELRFDTDVVALTAPTP